MIYICLAVNVVLLYDRCVYIQWKYIYRLLLFFIAAGHIHMFLMNDMQCVYRSVNICRILLYQIISKIYILFMKMCNNKIYGGNSYYRNKSKLYALFNLNLILWIYRILRIFLSVREMKAHSIFSYARFCMYQNPS